MKSLIYSLSLTCTTCFASINSSFPLGGDVSLGLDNFRSLPEGSWQGNMGAFTSMNLAYALPSQNQGFGIHVGGSFGVYNFEGQIPMYSKEVSTQWFITGGFFRQTPLSSGLNAGICYDWNINSKYSCFSLNTAIGQIRGQVGYLVKGGNEFGVWGTCGTPTETKYFYFYPIKFKAMNQLNAFWHHIFKNGAETTLWVGSPYGKGLFYSSGRAGKYILGTSFSAPLTSHLRMTGHGSYMSSRNGSAFNQARTYGANVSFALTYLFGGSKAGSRPYLPLADNSRFLVDVNKVY